MAARAVNRVSPSGVRALLAAHGIHPNKTLGQNFLIDRNVRDRIVETAAPGGSEVVLEIGPGLGALTEALLERAARVIAIEKDRGLVNALREGFADAPGLDLRHGDALDLLPDVLPGCALLAANLPYATGSRVLVECMQARMPPRIVCTVQREVAERVVASPGTGAYGRLSVLAQRDYAARLDRTVPATCFHPRPAVVSAVIVLERRNVPALREGLYPVHDLLTRELFGKRRKQLGGLLRALFRRHDLSAERADAALREAGIEPGARAENLARDDWIELTRACGSLA